VHDEVRVGLPIQNPWEDCDPGQKTEEVYASIEEACQSPKSCNSAYFRGNRRIL